MALTRNFKETVVQRVQNDATFAQALLDEAATLFLNGEPETARLILRDPDIFRRVTRSPTSQKSNPTVSQVVNEYGDENQNKVRSGKWET